MYEPVPFTPPSSITSRPLSAVSHSGDDPSGLNVFGLNAREKLVQYPIVSVASTFSDALNGANSATGVVGEGPELFATCYETRTTGFA